MLAAMNPRIATDVMFDLCDGAREARPPIKIPMDEKLEKPHRA